MQFTAHKLEMIYRIANGYEGTVTLELPTITDLEKEVFMLTIDRLQTEGFKVAADHPEAGLGTILILD